MKDQFLKKIWFIILIGLEMKIIGYSFKCFGFIYVTFDHNIDLSFDSLGYVKNKK